MSSIVLYSRPGCHLCDEAREGLAALLADGVRFELQEIDIEGDDELHRRMLERIPVVEVDGEIACEVFFDADAVRARIGTLSA